jgi:FxsC-like protein
MTGFGQSFQDYDAEQAHQGPYFFLSYAHQPRIDPDDPGDPNEWIHKLFRDLSHEVMELTDLPGGRQPGFMDRELRLGNEWPRRITEALSSCRVFIPLYSPRYFSSESCGKEWYAFHRRQVEHEANGGRHPEAIIPVLWVPVPDRALPQVAKSLQFDHHRLGEVYARGGFSQLIRINRYSDDYNMALHTLAHHIVRVAAGNAPVPAETGDFAGLDCAFGTAERKAANSRRLTVTIVTPDFYHLPKRPVGRDAEYYKPGAPTQWNPYRPESKIPLADYTSNLARGMGLVPEVAWFDETSGAPGDAGDVDGPGVMLVDPWAALDPDRGVRLREFHKSPKPWIQPMVPWSLSDGQTAIHERTLQTALDQALPSVPPPLPTLETFGNALPKAINAAVRNFLRHAEPRPPSVTPPDLPPGRARLLDTDGAPEPPPGFWDSRLRAQHFEEY